MAPKKAVKETKKEEKPKKPEMSAEMKELKEKENKLEKVAAPDRTVMDEASNAVQGEIDGLQEKLKKMNSEIADKSQGKEEHFKLKNEIRAKLDEFSAKIDELEKARSSMLGGMKEKQAAGREKRNELNSMKKKLGYEDVAEIDSKIRDIEYQMQTESLPLKKEKELMIKIKELKASKPLINKFKKMEEDSGPVDVAGIKGSIDEVKAQLSEVRDAKKLQQAALSKLIEARQKVMGDVPELFQKREALNGEVRALYAKRQESRDAFYMQQREYNAYMTEVRALRNDRYRIERNEKQKEWEATKGDREAEDTATVEVPFFAELMYLENMIRHLKSLQPKEAEETKAADVKPDTSAAPGEVLLAKCCREEEFFFAPTKKKQLKRKGGGKAKQISHDLGTLAFFDEYKVSTPSDVSQIPKTLEELDAKVAEFKVKQAAKIEKKAGTSEKAGTTETPEEKKDA